MQTTLNPATGPTREPPLWRHSFDIDGERGGRIKLAQLDRKTFALTSKIEYRGDTGLSGKVPPKTLDEIRTLDPAGFPNDEFKTDLASVPGATRWFLGQYGENTPAVLIHDWLIPTPPELEGMTDAHADRYLRFMLADTGVRWLKRWVMWTAVAMRTRFAVGGWRRWSVVLWILAALAGMTVFGYGIVTRDIRLVVVAGLAPFPLSLLWGRQLGAALVATLAAPWLLPPTAAAVMAYGVYLAIEGARDLGLWLLKRMGFARGTPRDTGTYLPEGV